MLQTKTRVWFLFGFYSCFPNTKRAEQDILLHFGWVHQSSPANSNSPVQCTWKHHRMFTELWVSNEHFYQIYNLLHLHQSYAVYLEIPQEWFEQYPGYKMNCCYQISNLIAGVTLCNIVLGNTTGCLLKLWVSNEHLYQISNLLHPVTSTSSCTWKYHRKLWAIPWV